MEPEDSTVLYALGAREVRKKALLALEYALPVEHDVAPERAELVSASPARGPFQAKPLDGSLSSSRFLQFRQLL